MRRRPNRFNYKRLVDHDVAEAELAYWREQVTYGGNPEHKRNPGDFGLTPPATPRPDKSLCDEIEVYRRTEALELLKEGIKRGLVSVQRSNGFPQNIWSMTADRVPLEAQLENRELGSYHGYPLTDGDPFADIVRESWGSND